MVDVKLPEGRRGRAQSKFWANAAHVAAVTRPEKEATVDYGECPNCGQDRRQGRHGHLDCVNECAAKGLTQKVFANMSSGEEFNRTPSGPGGMDVSDVKTVNPEDELTRLLHLKDEGKITQEQFEDKARRLFGFRATWMIRRSKEVA
jgi:hypothetical protein